MVQLFVIVGKMLLALEAPDGGDDRVQRGGQFVLLEQVFGERAHVDDVPADVFLDC